MHQVKNRLETCLKAGKDCTLLYSEKTELTGYVKSVGNGVLILERLGRGGDAEIFIDDIDEILHPLMEETSEGVFRIIRGNPPC